MTGNELKVLEYLFNVYFQIILSITLVVGNLSQKGDSKFMKWITFCASFVSFVAIGALLNHVQVESILQFGNPVSENIKLFGRIMSFLNTYHFIRIAAKKLRNS